MCVRVKICGVTSAAAVDAAVDAGADAIGFVLAPSPRRLELDVAARLAARVPPSVARVAVLRHPDAATVRAACAALAPHLVQAEPGPGVTAALLAACGASFLPVLHDGPTLLRRRLPAGAGAGAGPRGAAGVAVGAILLEARGRGGRGITPDWARAARLARRVRLVLAGGLTPENVGAAIRRVRPYAVDVSSGVERAPGVKDARLIRRFIAAVRDAAGAIDADIEADEENSR
jgi:phosphoribosylanthranilate isomerase